MKINILVKIAIYICLISVSSYLIFKGDVFSVILLLFWLGILNEEWNPSLTSRIIKKFNKKLIDKDEKRK